jgi:hypothetical protein
MTPPTDPLLGMAYAIACLALSVRIRTASWRARLWTFLAAVALDRAGAAVIDAQEVDR